MNRRHFMAAIGGVVAGAAGVKYGFNSDKVRIFKARSMGISSTLYPKCIWWQGGMKHPMLAPDIDKWAKMCRRYIRQPPRDDPAMVLCLESNYEKRKAMLT